MVNKNDDSSVRKGKVLLMDDDEVIRSAVQGLLSNLEYEVEACKDGWQALQMYKKAMEEESPFDAVVMDLNIPDGMGGVKAMEELLVIDPLAKGIISSGFSSGSVLNEYEKYGFCGVVEKPYKIEELDKVLREIIHPPAH